MFIIILINHESATILFLITLKITSKTKRTYFVIYTRWNKTRLHFRIKALWAIARVDIQPKDRILVTHVGSHFALSVVTRNLRMPFSVTNFAFNFRGKVLNHWVTSSIKPDEDKYGLVHTCGVIARKSKFEFILLSLSTCYSSKSSDSSLVLSFLS